MILEGVVVTMAVWKKQGNLTWVYDNTCKQCGEPFTSISAAARYCKNACKQKAYREKTKQRNARQRFVTAKGK